MAHNPAELAPSWKHTAAVLSSSSTSVKSFFLSIKEPGGGGGPKFYDHNFQIYCRTSGYDWCEFRQTVTFHMWFLCGDDMEWYCRRSCYKSKEIVIVKTVYKSRLEVITATFKATSTTDHFPGNVNCTVSEMSLEVTQVLGQAGNSSIRTH